MDAGERDDALARGNDQARVREENHMNQTTTERPRARYNEDGTISVQASAATDCRRALWYELTGQERTEEPDPSRNFAARMSLALRDVIMDAMAEDSWRISRLMPGDFVQTPVQIAPGVIVVGRPTAVVTADPAYDGDPEQRPAALVLKTRGDNSYRRWLNLGAERSHPEAVAQGAIYSAGLFGEPRDVVIATLNTAEREWDTERIPAERVRNVLADTAEWLAGLASHSAANAERPEVLPQRDFNLADYQCKTCPFLSACDPLDPDALAEDDDDDPDMITNSEAEMALEQYTAAKEAADIHEEDKKAASALLLAWMNQNGETKTRLGGRTISVIAPRRFSFNRKALNEILDPETRKLIVEESKSTPYARVY